MKHLKEWKTETFERTVVVEYKWTKKILFKS